MEEYQNCFHHLIAPLPQVSNVVLENTFMNGLVPCIKAEVECWPPVGLSNKMKMAQLVENQELTRIQAGLDIVLSPFS